MSNQTSISDLGGIPIVAFTSGKGGCGKTTLAVNFANVVFDAGARVLLIDFDLANHGCTGLFSENDIDPNEYLSTARLLGSDRMTTPNVFEVKRGFFVVPAGASNIPQFDYPDLGALINEIRSSLYALARHLQVNMIVLDCFCGIDILTTAGAGVADHTLIINEPDIVTFSGALTLLKHLELSFRNLVIKPKLHFVINRMRSNFTVADLSTLYRKNLESAIGEIVLCHFPYHPRIFDMFGKYPFVSDLLPKSLFVEKLELLTYLLFKGTSDNLIKLDVLKWSKRKVQSVYSQSIDRTAVDPGFLITKFTNFPLLMGIWLLFAFALFRTLPLTPIIGWSFIFVLGSMLSMIVASTLLHGCWLAARLNFALAGFRYRLGSKQSNVLSKSQFYIGTISPIISSILMSVSGLVLFFLLTGATCLLLDWIFNLGIIQEKAIDLRARQIQVSINGPIRTIDLRNATVKGVHFENIKTQSSELFVKNEVKLRFFDTSILVEKPVFSNCYFTDVFLNNSQLENCTFESCHFSDQGIREACANDTDSTTRITNASWEFVKFMQCDFPQPLIISDSSCSNVNIDVAKGQTKLKNDARYLGFFRCGLKLVRLNAAPDGNLVKTTDDNESQEPKPRLITGKNVESISAANYLRECSNAGFEPKLLTAELAAAAEPHKPTDLGSMANLIEMYILSADQNYISTAASLDEELLSQSIKQKKPLQEGYARLLHLILTIVDTDEKASIADALASWSSWLEAHDNHLAWDWSKWEQYSTRLHLSKAQADLIKHVIESSEGKSNTQGLQQEFSAITLPNGTQQAQ